MILTSGKKKNLINFERELLINKVKFVIARAYSVAIRQFVHHGFIKSPQQLNDDIGDKSNVSLRGLLSHFVYCRNFVVIKYSGVLVILRHGYFAGCSLFCGFLWI